MYMRIRCDYCGGKWEIYGHGHRDDGARRCPHCGAKIPRELWEQHVLPAYDAAASANDALYQDHVYNHSPLFQIDFIPDNIFAKRWKEAP